MEKKRRARINQSLDELKRIVVDAEKLVSNRAQVRYQTESGAGIYNTGKQQTPSRTRVYGTKARSRVIPAPKWFQ